MVIAHGHVRLAVLRCAAIFDAERFDDSDSLACHVAIPDEFINLVLQQGPQMLHEPSIRDGGNVEQGSPRVRQEWPRSRLRR